MFKSVFDRSILWLTAWLTLVLPWSSVVSAQPVLLDMPTQAAVDAQGNLYVLEPSQRRIARFDATGSLLGRFGSSGVGQGQFSSVTDIAVDAAAGTVLVLDRAAKAVSTFSSTGQFIGRWQVFAPNAPVSPNSLAVAGRRVFVSGSDGSLSAFSLTGSWLSSRIVITGATGPDSPGDLASDSSGNLYAVDRANNRVLRFGTSGPDLDPLIWRGWIGGCSAGPLCRAVPSGGTPARTSGWCNDSAQCGDPLRGAGMGRFNAPVFVSAAPDGAINVSDIGSGVVQRFDASGIYLGDLAQRGRIPGGTGADPTVVAPNGEILAMQTRLGRISRFAPDGTFRVVFGGGVELSVFPGDTLINTLPFTAAGQLQTATVGVTSIGGFTGPLTLASTDCIGPRGVPAVPCASLGITTSFPNPTVSVTGSPAAVPLGIRVSPSTPDGMTLVIVTNAAGSVPAFAQIAINVRLPRGISVAPTPSSLTLMPGDPPASVSVAFATTNVSGTITPAGDFTPLPPAGHLHHAFARPGGFTLGANSTETRTLRITALEKARSGNYVFSARARGPSNLTAEAAINVRVDCNCRTTGDFVLPSVRPTTAVSGLTGTSPDGQFSVTASSTGTSATVSVAAQSAPSIALVGPITNASSWGFSPDSRFFVVTSAGPASHITNLDVYDLRFQNRRVLSEEITGCPLGDRMCTPPPSFCYGGGASCKGGSASTTTPSFQVGAAAWGFGPNSRSFLFASVNPLVSSSQYNLAVYNLMTSPMATRIVDTSGPAISAFWRYSPCGDLLMHFRQAFARPSSNDQADFYRTDAATPVSPVERANLIVAANGAVASGPVGARVENAFFSTGDFDVRLLRLSRSSGSPADGFQSLQCRR